MTARYREALRGLALVLASMVLVFASVAIPLLLTNAF